jgi:glyoxylase-like metal-dependent hydrolase (beta-lactamase superfamily II)
MRPRYKIVKILNERRNQMRNKILRIIAIIIFACGITYPSLLVANSQIPGLGSPEVTEITENVLAVTGLYHSAAGNFTVNAGIIFTDRSVIFIDSGMSIASGEYLWEVARKRMKGDKYVYLILTHHHSDHVFGMHAIKKRGAKVITHKITGMWFKRFPGDKYKKFLAERDGWSPEKADEVFGNVIFSEPDRTIDQDTVLNIDGEEIHVLATPGHVANELSVYHPRSKALFAGDTIYEGSELTTRFGGLVQWKLWISQLERLKTLEISTIVPGHGKLCGEDEIDRNIECLKKEIDKRKKS